VSVGHLFDFVNNRPFSLKIYILESENHQLWPFEGKKSQSKNRCQFWLFQKPKTADSFQERTGTEPEFIYEWLVDSIPKKIENHGHVSGLVPEVFENDGHISRPVLPGF
jgi:hypothetical protein